MVPPRIRSLAATLPKNSFRRMGELQPVHSSNPYNSSLMPVRFWEVSKRRRSIMTSCAYNTIIGNFIGSDATGTKALANGHGVSILTSGFNRIGGTRNGERNIISGNIVDGKLVIQSHETLLLIIWV